MVTSRPGSVFFNNWTATQLGCDSGTCRQPRGRDGSTIGSRRCANAADNMHRRFGYSGKCVLRHGERPRARFGSYVRSLPDRRERVVRPARARSDDRLSNTTSTNRFPDEVHPALASLPWPDHLIDDVGASRTAGPGTLVQIFSLVMSGFPHCWSWHARSSRRASASRGPGGVI
jgi:hypothetical protein